jgi:hypothetical protein
MRILCSILLLATNLTAKAQEPFPAITGERADGTSVELPKASSGRHAIICLAYGQKAGPALEDWYGPAYLRFVAEHGLFASDLDVDVYFVPLFVGLNKAGYGPTMKKLREQGDPDVEDRVVFLRGDADGLRDKLGLKDKETPYIFVVDPQGRIVHRTLGAFSDDKLDAIEEAASP